MTNPQVEAETWVPEMNFGARLALVRHRMGWNIKEAAAACGLPAQSWRGWEIDGREPHRVVTIAVTIASRTGCDLDWLVYGPDRGRTALNIRYRPGQRVVTAVSPRPDAERVPVSLLRPVRQTRPIIGRSRRPLTPCPL